MTEGFRQPAGANATTAEDAKRLRQGGQAIGMGPQTTATGNFDVSPFVDGPLSRLEQVEGVEKLQYPEDLGENERYRYAMRILIFTQKKAPQVGIVNNPSAIDYAKNNATQRGRVNYDVVNARSIGAAAIGAAGTTAAAIGTNITKLAKSPAKLIAGKLLGELDKVAVSAASVAAAGVAVNQLRNRPSTLQTKPLAYINLFMPDGLNFVDRHDYDSVSVTDALGTLGIVSQGSSTEILGRLGERASFGGLQLLGQNFTELALYNSGYALNPQLEVLFKNTKNREFVFTFKFAPRNADEAAYLNSIIRTLRYHAATNFASKKQGADNLDVAFEGSRYIIPPSQFEIEFLKLDGGSAEYNDKLPKLAPCVLSNIDVNYAPGGQFSAYSDGNAVEVQLQLTFTETVILTKSDVMVGY